MATKARVARKVKAPKDVNAPKRNLSAYFLFTNARRVTLKAQYPEKKLTELTTLMAAEWKAMDEATKKTYQDRATADKENYLTKLAEYKKTDKFTQYQAKLSGWKEEQKLTASKNAAKKPKDVNAPKKSPTAYFLFTAKVRAEVQAANPDLKITEIAKVLGQKWKGISEEERKQYQDEANKLKEQHKITVENYKKSELYQAYIQKVAAWQQTQDDQKREEKRVLDQEKADRPKVSLPRKPKDPNAPKKPLTAYLLFSGSVRAQCREENPELKMTQIAGVIGNKWKALSEEEQKKWSDLSAKQKEEYKSVIADYQKSEHFAAFKAKMADWEKECVKRKEDANARYLKKKEKEAEAKTKKSPKMSKKKKMGHSKPKSKSKSHSKSKSKYSYDSDSSSYSSSSSSGSYSTSSSGSYSSSYSSSYSD